MARTGKAPRHFAESRKSQPIKLGSRDFLIAEIATRIINACADFNVGARRSKLIKTIGCALHQHGKIAFCGIFFLLHCHAPTRATTILGRQCDLYGGILDTRGSADDCYEGDLADVNSWRASGRCAGAVAIYGQYGECSSAPPSSGNCHPGACVTGDCKDGIGTMNFPSGGSYAGQFKEGKFWGKGVLRFCSGQIFEGSFKADLADGDFTITNEYPDCDDVRPYEGAPRRCRARATWQHGSVSTGVFRADKRQGTWTTVVELTAPTGKKVKKVTTLNYIADKPEGEMITAYYESDSPSPYERKIVASFKNGVEDVEAGRRRDAEAARAKADYQASRLQECQRLAYNLPGHMAPDSRGDIGRVCSNGWRYGSPDWVKCRDEMDACWDILNK